MLHIQQLTQSYGSSNILRGIDLTVPPAALTVLLGRNGVGKSTLLRTLMGLHPVQSGSVHWGKTNITHADPAQRVRAGLAYVPQGRDIFPRLTVTENLLMGAAARKAPTRLADEIYTLFPVLRAMGARHGGDLSGGQQQQLAIGRALMADPKLIILDEPTEGIQPNIIEQIGTALRWMVEERGMAVLLVEQFLDFVRPLADHYAVMSRGRIVAQGEGRNLSADGVEALIRV